MTDTPNLPPPYTLTGIVAPVAYYSAGSLGFVGVPARQTVTQNVTLANIGLQPLTISWPGITQDASNSFSITPGQCSDSTSSIPGSIDSNGECTLTITYTAPTSGTPSGTITFTDNAALSNLTSTASGPNFTQSLALSTTVATTAAPPAPPTTVMLTGSETITLTDTPNIPPPYTVTGINAAVAYYSAGSLGFVGVPAGQTVTQNVTLANIGLLPLVISGETITQDSSNSFSVTQVLCSDETSSIKDTLASGGECTLTVSYTAPMNPVVTPTGAPCVYPCGTISFTDSAALSNLTSTGSAPNFMQSLALSTTMSTTAAPAAPLTTVTIPTVNEPITVTDTPNIPPPYTVTGINAAVAYYSAGSLGFVGVPAGQTVTQNVTLANIGLLPLAISGETITQDSSNSFSVTQVLCSDGTTSIKNTLASGGECTLTISYTAPMNPVVTPSGAPCVYPCGTISFTDNAALSNLTSTGSAPNFMQSLALSTTMSTTAAPAAPLTTVTIPTVNESITVTDTPNIPPPYTETGINASVAYYSAGLLGFVGVPAGQTTTQNVTLANIGLLPLAISGETITQDSSNSFSITQVLCSDGTTSITDTLASGGECTLTVSYTAPSSGTPGGTITFTDTAALSNLTSTGTAPNFTQSLTLSITMSTTAAPAAPLTTVTIPTINESITVTDTPSAGVVSLSSQSITFGPPPSVLVGGTGTVSATSSSGLPVTFGTTTPSLCTVSGNVVTGVAVGSCIVTANQGGNGTLRSGPSGHAVGSDRVYPDHYL